jgi:mitochondrial fission protein ELM1
MPLFPNNSSPSSSSFRISNLRFSASTLALLLNPETLPLYPLFVTDGSLTLWLIGDGKPGHENQSLGLAEAMQRRVACEIHQISIVGKGGFFGRIRAALTQSAGLPKPDFIIAAGHATHLALLCLARKHQAKSIVLMRPSLPLRCFDLCIAPSHDFPKKPTRKNLILTRGAINRVRSVGSEKTGKLILIGGPSKTHGWDAAAVMDMLARVTATGGWQLTDSRRTPNGFLEQIKKHLPNIEIFSCKETAPDWLPDQLSRATEVWVSEDSVSMIYEALSSGARVGLLSVPRLNSRSRVLRGIDDLIADRFLTTFSDWNQTGRLVQATQLLNEADRCAEIVWHMEVAQFAERISP